MLPQRPRARNKARRLRCFLLPSGSFCPLLHLSGKPLDGPSPKSQKPLLLHGGVAERLKAPVLKTGVLARVPWVRIPPPPPLVPPLAGARGLRPLRACGLPQSRARPARALACARQGETHAAHNRRHVVLLDRYIVDFYAPNLRVVVEVDGGYHRCEGAPTHGEDRV
jgi:hypothetical protein